MNKISDSQIKWFTTQIRGPYLIYSNSKENMTSSQINTDVSYRKCSRCKILLLPPKIHFCYHLSNTFTRLMYGANSAGGFSSGLVTVTEHAIETNHEKLETLANKHWKV